MRNPASLSAEKFDLLVIGGGIAGACAAWDAAQRGLSVALVERNDFSSATSAQSLKILHGGIRYLQHLDIVRLRESCRERMAFLRIAPHLTRPLGITVPTYGFGMQGKLVFRVALALNHLLTIDRNLGLKDESRHILAGHILSRKETIAEHPYVEKNGLTGASVFYDGQIMNPPRLVWSIVQAAIRENAVACNYCEVTSLIAINGKVAGAEATDRMTGDRISIQARAVINATGPFAQSFVANATSVKPLDVPLSRDMAFVLKRKILDETALAVQTRYKDPDALLSRGNRHIFVTPWRDYTAIGVSSRVFTEPPDQLTVSEFEIDSFIEEVNEALPSIGINRDEIDVINAGLLPFGENALGAANLSFGKRSLIIDHGAHADGPDGLITAMSVRWTMGRLTAQRAVDMAEQYVHNRTTTCNTNRVPVSGGDFESFDDLRAEIQKDDIGAKLKPEVQEHLLQNYGSNWRAPLELGRQNSLLLQQIADFPVIAAELAYAVKFEMAQSLEDCVLRRTDIGTGEKPSNKALQVCANVLAAELGWGNDRKAVEIARVQRSYPFYGKRESHTVEQELA